MAADLQPAIETKGLTRRFGALIAVDRLDLCVGTGHAVGLLGSNGAGKTTILKMLTTLLPPTSGQARVAGYDVRRQAREVRRRIGYVPQMLSADAGLTARENLLLSARLYGLPRKERRERVSEGLHFMGLTEVSDRLVRTYSGGMIRRLEIAQALLHRPQVLFLDEPTVGLDPVARHSVWDRIVQLRRHFGASVLLTTHDMEEADALCETLVVLHQGQRLIEGTPAELKASVGPSATLDDVFIHFTGGSVQAGGEYREVARARRTAQRLG
ncbi:MAG: ABC transporter ATP-binding protein [Myxococcaceae bacterium]